MKDFTKSFNFRFNVQAKGDGGGTTASKTTGKLSKGQRIMDRIAAENAQATQPFFMQLLNSAMDPANNPQFFPGNTVAGFNPIQQAAQGSLLNTAQFLDQGVNPMVSQALAFGLGFSPMGGFQQTPFQGGTPSVPPPTSLPSASNTLAQAPAPQGGGFVGPQGGTPGDSFGALVNPQPSSQVGPTFDPAPENSTASSVQAKTSPTLNPSAGASGGIVPPSMQPGAGQQAQAQPPQQAPAPAPAPAPQAPPAPAPQAPPQPAPQPAPQPQGFTPQPVPQSQFTGFAPGGGVLGPNPFLQQYMRVQEDPMISRFQAEVLPQIGSQAQSQGAFGGVRQGLAEASAASGLAKQVGDMRTSLAFQGYNRGLDSFDRTLAGLPSTLNTFSRPAELLGAVGDTIQQQQQAQINADIDRFNFNQNPELQRASQYADLLGSINNLSGGTFKMNAPIGSSTVNSSSSGGK